MDRRKQKSQQAIMSAFLELMKEKEFEKISISEIANKANVNRGTIYLHYLDKYDLLEKCIEFYLGDLVESCLNGENSEPLSKESLLNTFQYLQGNADFFGLLLKDAGLPTFRSSMEEVIVETLKSRIGSTHEELGITFELPIQFLSSAVAGVLVWWFTNDMLYSPTDMMEEVWSLLENNKLLFNPLLLPSETFAQRDIHPSSKTIS